MFHRLRLEGGCNEAIQGQVVFLDRMARLHSVTQTMFTDDASSLRRSIDSSRCHHAFSTVIQLLHVPGPVQIF